VQPFGNNTTNIIISCTLIKNNFVGYVWPDFLYRESISDTAKTNIYKEERKKKSWSPQKIIDDLKILKFLLPQYHFIITGSFKLSLVNMRGLTPCPYVLVLRRLDHSTPQLSF
jgi:hypothetical protein